MGEHLPPGGSDGLFVGADPLPLPRMSLVAPAAAWLCIGSLETQPDRVRTTQVEVNGHVPSFKGVEHRRAG